MAKRRKQSASQVARNRCMSVQIPKQREKMMKRLHKRKLTREEHNKAFTNASHVCTK